MVNHYLKPVWLGMITLALGVCLSITGFSGSANENKLQINSPQSRPVYDLSQWQGQISGPQAAALKNEAQFVILKAENGGLVTDPQFNHSANEMNTHGVPYGAYDYSLYANDDQARAEADALYQRAPQANFYVNDSETNHAKNGLDSATQAWANEIHQLTSKPAILYSNLSFMNHFQPQTRNAYDGLWVADYGVEPDPNYHYDLWQYTDRYPSSTLKQRVDASIFPKGTNKPEAFWIGGPNRDHSSPIQEVSPNSDYSKSRIKYNSHYYRSNRVKALKVIGKSGINLYSLNRKKIDHVKFGTVLRVKYYKHYCYHTLGNITKAIGVHNGKPDLFSSNKAVVKWYRR